MIVESEGCHCIDKHICFKLLLLVKNCIYLGITEVTVMFIYEDLPDRFKRKLDTDLNYLLHVGIPGLEQICLFGSVARGDYKWNSDLDLAIVTTEPLRDHTLRGEISGTLDLPIEGVTTDVVFRVLKNNNNSMSRVFDQVYERDKVILWKKIKNDYFSVGFNDLRYVLRYDPDDANSYNRVAYESQQVLEKNLQGYC